VLEFLQSAWRHEVNNAEDSILHDTSNMCLPDGDIDSPFAEGPATSENVPSLFLLNPIQLEGNAVIVASQLSFNPVVHQVGATEFDGRIGCTCLAVNSRH